MAWLDGQTDGRAGGVWQGWWWCGALGGEGKFDTAGGVALVTGHALQAAVVVQVTCTTGANTVHFSMGELSAFHVDFNFLCSNT